MERPHPARDSLTAEEEADLAQEPPTAHPPRWVLPISLYLREPMKGERMGDLAKWA